MITVLIAILSLALYYYWRKRKDAGQAPSLPSFPVLGSIPFMSMKLHVDLLKYQKKYGDIFRFDFGWKPYVVLSNYETVKKVLSDDASVGRDTTGTWADPNRKDGIVHGVIFSTDNLWKEHRRFALSTLRDFGMGKSWLEDAILDEVSELCTQISTQGSKPLNPRPLISCSIANIICALIFGKRFSHEDERFVKFSTLTSELVQDMENVKLFDAIPWLKNLPRKATRALDALHDKQDRLMAFLESLVEEHELNRGDSAKSFVDAYLQEAERRKEDALFSRFQLIATLMDLFEAGSETTSTTLLWAFLFLHQNPDVYEKVKLEISSKFAADQRIRMDDRISLPYTDATLMEIQRLASLVPINVPHQFVKDTTIDGYRIQNGTYLMTNNYFIHRDPRYWKEPERFDPTRFLDERGKVFRPDGFMPFSVGKRSCLGESLAKMELWLFFTNLVNRFDFHMASNLKVSPADVPFGLVLSPPAYELIFQAT